MFRIIRHFLLEIKIADLENMGPKGFKVLQWSIGII